ncbi:hypothetical protein ACFPRL_30335 [Pseudoclavibacter helvolus]
MRSKPPRRPRSRRPSKYSPSWSSFGTVPVKRTCLFGLASVVGRSASRIVSGECWASSTMSTSNDMPTPAAPVRVKNTRRLPLLSSIAQLPFPVDMPVTPCAVCLPPPTSCARRIGEARIARRARRNASRAVGPSCAVCPMSLGAPSSRGHRNRCAISYGRRMLPLPCWRETRIPNSVAAHCSSSSIDVMASSAPSCHSSQRTPARSQRSRTSSRSVSTRLSGSVLTRGSCSPSSCSRGAGFAELLGKALLLRHVGVGLRCLDCRAELASDRCELRGVLFSDRLERSAECVDDELHVVALGLLSDSLRLARRRERRRCVGRRAASGATFGGVRFPASVVDGFLVAEVATVGRIRAAGGLGASHHPTPSQFPHIPEITHGEKRQVAAGSWQRMKVSGFFSDVGELRPRRSPSTSQDTA